MCPEWPGRTDLKENEGSSKVPYKYTSWKFKIRVQREKERDRETQMKNILGKSICLNTQACSGEWIALHLLKLLPRSPPSQLCTGSLDSVCVSCWASCPTGLPQGWDISNSYGFPIANWRKEIFFHLWLHCKTVVDISTCPTGTSFSL